MGTEGAGGPASATGPEQGPCDHAPPCVRLSHVSLTSLSRRPSRRLSRRLSRHFIPLFRALRSSRALAPNPLPAFYLLHRCRGVHSRGPTRHHRGLRKRRAHREEDRICANPLRRDCTFRFPAPCAPTPPQPPPQHLAARAPPHPTTPHPTISRHTRLTRRYLAFAAARRGGDRPLDRAHASQAGGAHQGPRCWCEHALGRPGPPTPRRTSSDNVCMCVGQRGPS